MACAVAAGLLACAPSITVHAQPGVVVPPTEDVHTSLPGVGIAREGFGDGALDALVRALASDDFAQRERAEAGLRESGVTDEQIERQLARPDLELEQRRRLERIGYARFELMPRAALGVQFARVGWGAGAGGVGGAGADPVGVTIERTTPGFDSTRVFQPGDILRSLGGITIPNQIEARPIIVSFDPGQEVPVEIIRAGEVQVLTVRLGNFANLAAADALSPAHKRRAWQYRLLRAGVGEVPAPPQAPMDPARYRRIVGDEERALAASAQQARTLAQSSQLPDATPFRVLNFVQAGSRRPPTEDARAEFDPDPAGRQITKPDGGFDIATQVRQQIRQLELMIRENTLRLKNAQLPEEVRARLEQQNRTNSQTVSRLRAQLLEIKQAGP